MATTYSEPGTLGYARTRRREPVDVQRFKDAVSWAAILAAGAISIGLLFVATSFWNALAFSSDVNWVADNLAWFYAGTAIVVLLIAGVLAGWLSPGRFLNGMVHGMAVWGLFITGAVVFRVGSALPLTTLTDASSSVSNASPGSFWPTFVAYSIGLVAALIGGALGALIPRPDVAAHDEVIDLRESQAEAVRERETEPRVAARRAEYAERTTPTV